jgi:hypothetical protein
VGNVDEVARVARRLVDRALPPYDRQTDWHSNVTLDAHALEAYLPSACLMDGSAHLCPKPELGSGSSHGGSDHPTSIDVLPPDNDVDPTRGGCQGPKRELLGPLQAFIIGRAATRLPVDVMFGMARIDNVWLSFVPAEPTVHVGALINGRVSRLVGSTAETRVVGLANSYVEYIATEEEYQFQRYEGGSTLYGPKSAQYFADRADILARAALGQVLPGVDTTSTHIYELGPVRNRLPLVSNETPASQLGAARAPGGLCRMHDDASIALCFWWTDVGPATALSTPAPWIRLVDASSVPVHACGAWGPLRGTGCDPAAAIDDRGADFRTTIHARVGNAFEWGTIFRPTNLEWATMPGKVQISVAATDAPPLLLQAISTDKLPAYCTFEQAAHCALD